VSRHFDDLDAVLKSDSLDDFRQLIFALQSSPGFCGGVDEFEHHELGGRRRHAAWQPHWQSPYRSVQSWPRRVNSRTVSPSRADDQSVTVVFDLVDPTGPGGRLGSQCGILKPLTTMLSGVLGFAERYRQIAEMRAIVVGFENRPTPPLDYGATAAIGSPPRSPAMLPG
jgi:hypothetical protein